MVVPDADKKKWRTDTYSGSASAKIAPPGLGSYYPRKRLFKLLNRYQSKPAVWVSGPAGSGKTMLMASYLKSRETPYLWYQIDARDVDPATLFYYLGLAVKQKAPRRRTPLPFLTPKHLDGLSAFTRNFFEALYEWLNPPFALVFDNYQELAEDTQFHQMIRDAIAVLPPKGQVVLISRSEPPPALSRLQVHREMVLLGWQALQLNANEVRALGRVFRKTPLTKPEAAAVHSATMGWAAGVVLLLAQPRQDSKSIDFTGLSAPEAIFDYFAGEILAQLDDATRNFLVKSAFLPQISATMANALTGSKNAGRILAELARNNYFTMQRSHRRPRQYQYHPLFKDFLQQQARALLTPDDLQNLQNRAATLLIENSQYEDAAELLRSAGRWDRLAELICGQAQYLVAQGRLCTLQAWLQTLPPEMIEQQPWLRYWLGICKMAVDLTDSRSCFENAFRHFKAEGDTAGIYLAWIGIIDTFVYEWNDFAPLDLWIREGERLSQSVSELLAPEIEARVTVSMFCALIYRRPDHPDMAVWERRMRSVIFNSSDFSFSLAMSSHLMLYYTWWVGRQREAQFIAARLKQTIDVSDVEPLQQIVWHSIEGIYLWMTYRFDESYEVVREGIHTAEKTGIHIWNFSLFATMVHMSLCQEDTDTARAYLDKMSFVLGTNRTMDICHFYYLKANEALVSGNRPLAMEHIQLASRLARESGAPFVIHWVLTGMADIHIDRGEYEQADQCLQEAMAYGLKMKSGNIQYQCAWLWARLSFKRNQSDKGLYYLQQFLALSRKYNTINHAWWRSAVMAELYIKALEANIEVDYVSYLIRRRKIVPSDPSLNPEHWPWPIRIYCLGRFKVIVDDKTLESKSHGQSKPLALLKAIVAFGGRQVSEERLSDALWPDADGDVAHVAFTTTLHRLRKLIGPANAIVLQGRRLSLDPRLCWVDVWTLQHVLAQVDQMMGSRQGDTGRISDLAEQMLALYQGPFLVGDEDPWGLGARESIRSRVMRRIEKIASSFEKQQQWEPAIAIYERGLEIDYLVEAFYQGLMRCYLQMDRRADALAAYERCRKILRYVFDVSPSKETETFRRKIQN